MEDVGRAVWGWTNHVDDNKKYDPSPGTKKSLLSRIVGAWKRSGARDLINEALCRFRRWLSRTFVRLQWNLMTAQMYLYDSHC